MPNEREKWVSDSKNQVSESMSHNGNPRVRNRMIEQLGFYQRFEAFDADKNGELSLEESMMEMFKTVDWAKAGFGARMLTYRHTGFFEILDGGHTGCQISLMVVPRMYWQICPYVIKN